MIGRHLPPLDLTDADLARALDKVAEVATDALYVSVGFGIVTVQRAQVRRRELLRAVRSARRQVSSGLRSGIGLGA